MLSSNGSNPTIIQTKALQLKGMKMMSALQLKNDLTHDEPTLADIAVVERSLSELTLKETSSSQHEHHDTRLEGLLVKE